MVAVMTAVLIGGGIAAATTAVTVYSVNKTRQSREETKQMEVGDDYYDAKTKYMDEWSDMLIVVGIVGLLAFLAYILFIRMNLFDEIKAVRS